MNLLTFEFNTELFFIITTCISFLGMFPFAMLFTQFLFCSTDWPRKIFCHIPDTLKLLMPEEIEKKTSCHCIYNKEVFKSEVWNFLLFISKLILDLFIIYWTVVQFYIPTKGFFYWTGNYIIGTELIFNWWTFLFLNILLLFYLYLN